MRVELLVYIPQKLMEQMLLISSWEEEFTVKAFLKGMSVFKYEKEQNKVLVSSKRCYWVLYVVDWERPSILLNRQSEFHSCWDKPASWRDCNSGHLLSVEATGHPPGLTEVLGWEQSSESPERTYTERKERREKPHAWVSPMDCSPRAEP